MAEELLELNRRLLDAIALGDWLTYEELCDPSLTAFEPEGCGNRIDGLAFHRFYFEQIDQRSRSQTTMIDPHVRQLGDTAIISYVRLVQRIQPDGQATSASFEETRVWHRHADGSWKHVHFHRSRPG